MPVITTFLTGIVFKTQYPGCQGMQEIASLLLLLLLLLLSSLLLPMLLFN